MKISYQGSKLEKTLKDTASLKQKYGGQMAEKIKQCLQDLDASDTLANIPQRLRPHPREPKSEEIFQVDIVKHTHPTRLYFRPVGEYDIEDYETVTQIEILEIIKTHS